MHTFSETFSRLRQDADESHRKRMTLIRDLQAAIARDASEAGRRLAAGAQRRRQEFKAMMTDIRGTIQRQACETRDRLAAMAADLHAGGATFNHR
jgi:hypothetical protein